MSATPRTIRAVPMPLPARTRRVAGVNARPVGAVTMFLVAITILGLTSLGLVWQAGQRTAATMHVQYLQSVLQNELNANSALTTELNSLQSPSAVMKAAYARYGMRIPNDPSAVHVIVVPGPVVTRLVTVTGTSARSRSAATVPVSATDTGVTTWWQDAWIMLYKLLG